MSSGPFLYPNVTSLPSSKGVDPNERELRKPEGTKSEFDLVLDKTLDIGKQPSKLDQVRDPLKFSAHAASRMAERKINLSSEVMAKVNDAIDKAAAKGVEDTLVLTKDAALIVNVKNRTVVTAMDKNSLNGNVFTQIDGAVIV